MVRNVGETNFRINQAFEDTLRKAINKLLVGLI